MFYIKFLDVILDFGIILSNEALLSSTDNDFNRFME